MTISTLSPGDQLGRTIVALGSTTLNLASATAQTLMTLPNFGNSRVRISSVVLENPVGLTTPATVSFGSSGALTDLAPAASLGVAFPVVVTPTTDTIYTGGMVFRANVTVAGTGTCTATLYGYLF